ncbi:hypothetical protein DFP72DRAFT_1070810 [Ephemerocybe angulata]|uniref:Uncharacterized protein n=1 Tax=Ephemerocybe angulata TaxID=980116 RepID=A0A8H6M4R5_9AGAR|nr:hypothetical protein DFP72DRAFT_1070810 [Tulosesus angulatus]
MTEFNDIALPQLDVTDADSVRAYNAAVKRRKDAGDPNPPPMAILRSAQELEEERQREIERRRREEERRQRGLRSRSPTRSPSRERSPPRQISMDQLTAALATLTPNSRKTMLKGLCRGEGMDVEEDEDAMSVDDDGEKKGSKVTPKTFLTKLLTGSRIKPFDSNIHGTNSIPEVIGNLIVCGHHIPLTMLTDKALDRFRTNDVKYITDFPKHEYKKFYGDKKIKIPDAKDFDAENTLTYMAWSNAWANLRTFLLSFGDKEVHDLYDVHHRSLLREKSFDEVFPAILTMDIQWRSMLNNELVEHVEARWNKEMAECRSDHLLKRLAKAQTSSRQDNRNARRSHPYSNNRNNTNQLGGSSSTSFRSSSSSGTNSNANRGPPLCIACQRAHSFKDCKEEKFPSGKPTFAHVVDGQLLARSTNSSICFGFNIAGCSYAKHKNGSDSHVCSFCGDSGHHACGRSCPRFEKQ